MAQPLSPKVRPDNTHPLLQHRLAARRNGHPIVMATLKTRSVRKWNAKDNSLDAIQNDREWQDHYFAGTAVRIEGDLCVIDIDCTLPWLVEKILTLIRLLDPQAYEGAIHRTSGGVSRAIFFRCRKPFGRRATRRYTAHPEKLAELQAAQALPEATEEEYFAKAALIRSLTAALEPQHVEIWGPESKGRYFQYEGPHSPGRDYKCLGKAFWNLKREELPYLPGDPGDIVDQIEALLAAELTLIPDSAPPAAEVVWDLQADDVFVSQAGEEETYAELEARLEPGAENGVRGCMGWTARAASQSQSNCNCYVTQYAHRLVVKDWSHDGVEHRMAKDMPPPHVELDADTIAVLQDMHAAAAAPADPIPEESPYTSTDSILRGDLPETGYVNAMAWLLLNVAYCTQAYGGRGGAVSIHPDGEFPTPVTVAALRGRMQSYCYETVGVRQGITRHNPVDGWGMHPERICIGGVRMRPELPRPLFEDAGQRFINRYVPPRHPPGGSLDEFERFFTRLVPDISERAWAWNWIACLAQHPEWRMIALVMVAREMGTGRGLLAEALAAAFGTRFVSPLPYSKLSGGAGARFNAEIADKLLIYINESRDADERKFAHKNAAREALKDFIEPNHKLPFRVEPKGLDAYTTLASVSTLMFSNNVDGLPLGEGDRRAAIVLNGPQMTVEERDAFRGWLSRPENIGALWRALMAHKVEQDRRVFDPYMAPEFHGRDLMIEASKTGLDLAWEAAIGKLSSAADLATMTQIVAMVRHYAKSPHSGDFDDLVRKHQVVNGYRIGVKQSTNWLVRFEGEKERVYAFNERARKRYTGGTPEEVKQQLFKAQKVVEAPRKAFNKLLKGVETAAEEE